MNNTQYSSGGFTIIEVVLFLAVSSLLLLGAMVGVSNALKNTQFNDTTDTTQSFFQKKYISVVTGVNFREPGFSCDGSGYIVQDPMSTTRPGESNCVVLGRMLSVSPGTNTAANKVTVQYLSSVIPTGTITASDLGSFSAGSYQPRISSIATLTEEYELPWSALVTHAKLVQGVNQVPITHIAIMRSPVSERMLIYGFNGAPASTSQYASISNLIQGDKRAALCIQSESGPFAKKAILNIGDSGGENLFSIDRSGADVGTVCS